MRSYAVYAAAAVAEGGLGITDEQIHVQYLGQLVNLIGALGLIAALGPFLEGPGFIIRSRTR